MFEKPRLRTVSSARASCANKAPKTVHFTSHHTPSVLYRPPMFERKAKSYTLRSASASSARRSTWRRSSSSAAAAAASAARRRVRTSSARAVDFRSTASTPSRARRRDASSAKRAWSSRGGVSSVNDSGEGPANDARRLASRICANNESNNAVSLRTNSFVSTSALCSSYAPRVSARRARVLC